MRLTNTETLQFDDEDLELTSYSLSTSHSIIDDISPDAYWYMYKCNKEHNKKIINITHQHHNKKTYEGFRFKVEEGASMGKEGGSKGCGKETKKERERGWVRIKVVVD